MNRQRAIDSPERWSEYLTSDADVRWWYREGKEMAEKKKRRG